MCVAVVADINRQLRRRAAGHGKQLCDDPNDVDRDTTAARTHPGECDARTDDRIQAHATTTPKTTTAGNNIFM